MACTMELVIVVKITYIIEVGLIVHSFLPIPSEAKAFRNAGGRESSLEAE